MALSEKEVEVLRIYETTPAVDRQQLATMVDLSLVEVERMLSDLRKRGILLKERGVVNWERTGVPYVAALIEVRVTPQREVGFDAVAQRIARFPEVRALYLVSGTYDLAVYVTGKTMQDVASFIASKVSAMEGVQGTVTHFLLKTYKEDGVLVEEEQPPARLPITP
jgi:DNA-binding Lrp family transcriptional regulator